MFYLTWAQLARRTVVAVVGASLAFGGGYAYGHRDALPTCATEDSPACVWIDPDTGARYVNGDDAGMSVCERYELNCEEKAK